MVGNFDGDDFKGPPVNNGRRTNNLYVNAMYGTNVTELAANVLQVMRSRAAAVAAITPECKLSAADAATEPSPHGL